MNKQGELGILILLIILSIFGILVTSYIIYWNTTTSATTGKKSLREEFCMDSFDGCADPMIGKHKKTT